MFIDKYASKSLFPYADNYYAIFPKGLENNCEIGAGSLIVEDDYLIYFKSNTPEEIKKRFIKDYAEYHKKQLELGDFDDKEIKFVK